MPYALMCGRTAKAVLLTLALVLGQTSGDGALAQSPTRLLNQVALEVTSVEDSSHYLLYRYRLRNSVSSVSGVAGINLDLSAQRGTGVLGLPSTGRFVHGAEAGVGPISDHVPVGVINPEGWTSGLARRNAILSWGPREGYESPNGIVVAFADDSASPGGSKEGFGLRSPFLPGVRRFSAEPTLASCCSQYRPGSHGEYPVPGHFRVSGFTVAPTVRPQDMTIKVLLDDLQQTCGELRWITDGAVCSRFRSTLEPVSGRQADPEASRTALRTVRGELEAQHGSAKPVNDNAYWLLKVNAEYLLAYM